MKLLKFLLTDYEYESRDLRETKLAHELGFEVFVFGWGADDRVYLKDGITVRTTPTYKGTRLAPVNHMVSFVKRLRAVRSMEYDAISCHDLIALSIGFLASLGRKPKPLLIYDAHEFELGRCVNGGKRGALSTAIIAQIERFLIKRCVFTIAVNDSIADEMARIHRVERPIVARNVPEYCIIDHANVKRARKELFSSVPENLRDSFSVMYHGRISRGRGIEEIIEAISLVEGTVGFVLGDGQPAYVAQLLKLVEDLGVQDRVIIHSAVPKTELESYVAVADLGMVIIKPVSKSYELALPNKLFENIQAENPVIVTDYPEVSRIVNAHNLGLVCNLIDPGEIAACINRMKDDPTLFDDRKESVIEAKKILCWENEKRALSNAYSDLLNNDRMSSCVNLSSC